jgi:hypothetical protein
MPKFTKKTRGKATKPDKCPMSDDMGSMMKGMAGKARFGKNRFQAMAAGGRRGKREK